MATANKKYIIAAVLSLIGSLYSGYLAFFKLIYGYCEFTPCPELFGVTVCLLGFLAFFAVFLLSVTLAFGIKTGFSEQLLKFLSVFGIAFAGVYAINEILFPNCPGGICAYPLFLPSCVIGTILFLWITYSILKK